MRERNRRLSAGFTRAEGILLALVAVLAVMTAVPFVRGYLNRSAAFHCSLSVAKMQDLVDIEVLHRGGAMSEKDVRAFLDDYAERGEILCPSGGEFDVEDNGGLSKKVFCCLHDSDGVRRTTYSARRCLDRIQKAVRSAQIGGTDFPETVRVTLNGKPLDAKRVREATGLRRGTSTTDGYKGIVAFYALAESGTADTADSDDSADTADTVGTADSADTVDTSDTNGTSDSSEQYGSRENGGGFLPDSAAGEGEVWYFSYADEDHAAVWTIGGGWRIDKK